MVLNVLLELELVLVLEPAEAGAGRIFG